MSVVLFRLSIKSSIDLAFFAVDSSIVGIDEVGVKLDARVVRAEKSIIHTLRIILLMKIYSLVLFALIPLLYSTHPEVDLIHSNFLVVIPR